MRKLLFISLILICLIPFISACSDNQPQTEQVQPEQEQPEQEQIEQSTQPIDFETEFRALINNTDPNNYFLPQQFFALILTQEGQIADDYILEMMFFLDNFCIGLDAEQVLATLSAEELTANAYSQYMAEGDTFLQIDSLIVAEILDGKLSEGMAAYINLAGHNSGRSIFADGAIIDWHKLADAVFAYYDYLQKYPDHLMAEVADSLFHSYWDSLTLAFYFDNSYPYDSNGQIEPHILETYQYILDNHQDGNPDLYADIEALLAAWQENQGLHDQYIQDLILLIAGKYY